MKSSIAILRSLKPKKVKRICDGKVFKVLDEDDTYYLLDIKCGQWIFLKEKFEIIS